MRIVSARSVVPVDRPSIAEGAVALDDDGTVRMVGPRAAVCAAFSALPEERAEGVLVPGLINAHCHLELSALANTVPGGGGFIAWAQRFLKTVGETPRERRRVAAREAAAAAVRLGTAAIGDVGNTLDAAPAIGEARLHGVLFHELLGSREATTGDALADAARERAQAEVAASWPENLGYVRAPHAPYSVGPDLMRRIFAAAATEQRATSIHVAEDEEELKLLRDGTGAWPAMLAAMGIDAAARAPGKAPVEYLASLGAFDGGAPPLLVHMVHAGADDRRLAREAGATVVLCPRSNLHIGGQLADVPALLADGVRSRSVPTASPPRPTCLCGARWRRWPPTSRRCRPPAGWRPPPEAAPTPSAFRRTALSLRASAPACSTCWSAISQRRSNRWSAIRTPRSAGWPDHDDRRRSRRGPRRRAHAGHEVRADDQVRAHAVRAPLRDGGGGDRGARTRPLRRAHRRDRGRHGRRAHGGDGVQPDRRPALRRPEPADRQARDPGRRHFTARRLDDDAGGDRRFRRRGRGARAALPRALARRSLLSLRLLLHQAVHGALPPVPRPGHRFGPGRRLDRRARRLRLGAGPPHDRRRLLDRRLRHPLRSRRPRLRPRRRSALDPGAVRRRRRAFPLGAPPPRHRRCAAGARLRRAARGALPGRRRRGDRAACLRARHRPPERSVAPRRRLFQPERLRLGRLLRRHARRHAGPLDQDGPRPTASGATSTVQASSRKRVCQPSPASRPAAAVTTGRIAQWIP